METIDAAYRVLLWGSVIFLSLLMCAFLIQAVLGPRFTDRIVSINLISTKGIVMIAILSHLRADSSLLDIAVVYSMVSFLVVVILSKCYMSLYQNDPYDLYAAPGGKVAGKDTKEDAK